MTSNTTTESPPGLEPSDADIYEAMREIPGYLDITPGDFKDLYRLAHRLTLQRLSASVKAGDIMTKKVFTVSPETALQEAATLMAESDVSGVPVINSDSEVVGVLSGKDFLSRMGQGESNNFMTVIVNCLNAKGCAAISIRGKMVKDIMTTPAITVTADSPLSELFTLLHNNSINRLPVIDHQKHLIGIVSREDILHTHIPSIQGSSEA